MIPSFKAYTARSVLIWRSLLVRMGTLSAILSVLAAPPARAQQFYDMGSLNGVESGASDVSADGSIVVGWSSSPASGPFEPAMWTRDLGLTSLGVPSTAKPVGKASAISADGGTIVGWATSVLGANRWPQDYTPLMWRNGQVTALATLPSREFGGAVDVSGDGLRILGYVDSGGGYGAERSVTWTNGVPTVIGQGISDVLFTRPFAISSDATTVVLDAVFSDGSRAYRLDGGVFTGLQQSLEVTEVSADGFIAVGRADAGVVRWFRGVATPQVIGGLPGSLADFATGVSGDGVTVLAYSAFTSPSQSWNQEAWMWTPTGGIVRIDDYLQTASLGNAISGWKFTSVNAISDDGKILVGEALNPSGYRRGWVADLRRIPNNDKCENAAFLGEGPISDFSNRTTLGTTEDAGPDGANTCGFGGGPDVWYEFSAPIAGYLKIDLCGSLLANPVISVHRGCPGGSFNQVFCANDCADPACNGACIDPQWVPIDPGTSYFIRVSSDKGFAGGLFTLNTRFVPHADACADASVVAVPSTTSGVTLTATIDNVNQCDGTPVTAPGVWYRVIGTGTTMTASLCGGADYDTKLSVYCSGCTNQTCVGQSDDACGLQSEVSWCSAPGHQYYILVHGFDTNAGTFDLSVSADATPCGFSIYCAPTNDDCSSPLPLEPGTLLVDNGGADNGNVATNCGGISNDLWYSYTPRCSGLLTVDTCQAGVGTLDDTVLSVLDMCNGFELACSNDFQDATVDCGLRSVVTIPTIAGTELQIRAGGYPTTGLTGTFPLRVTEVADPVFVPASTSLSTPQDLPFQFDVGITGGCPPFITSSGNAYFVSANGLPEGVTMDALGVVQGTPTESGFYPVTYSVNDGEITTPGVNAALDLTVLPGNDDCANAQLIKEGGLRFGTQTTTTDGPEEPGVCDFFGNSQIENDVWFLYESACLGVATVDLCNSSFDTKVAVYPDASCPGSDAAIACNDDEVTGTCGSSSRVSFAVVDGSEYLIRVGGFEGATGNGELLVTCFDDCNDNGVNDQIDLTPGSSSEYLPVDFSALHNGNLQTGTNISFPSGEILLGGVPFVIPASGDNYWHSAAATGPNPRTINIPVGRFGVMEVHTLINTYWGQGGPASYASLEFLGSDGAYFRKDLIGNEDIRDFKNFFWTNNINGTTTVNVVWVNPDRLDKQRIVLPSDFHNETLSTIRLSDIGGDVFQRTFLAGVTVLVGTSSSDCNGNSRPDECDTPGDADGDDMLTLNDFAFLRDCLTIPCGQPFCKPSLYSNSCCAMVDLDTDGDVDLLDFAMLQNGF
jgi:uncharacterized membrane protein